MDGCPQMHLGMESFAQAGSLRASAAGAAPLEAAERHALMVRTLALLFAAGASLSLILFLALPHPEANVPGMLATIGVTFMGTAWVAARGDQIPMSAFPWLVACGTLLITVGIHFRGEPTAPHALFYLWIVFYSCYFLSRPVAALQLALALAGYGAVLVLADEPRGEALELWLVAASGLLVSGVLITMLKEQVDGMVLQLADAARTDPLTGLLNRRGFDENFEFEVERSRRGDHSLSVLIGDLDGFKKINDVFGHYAGDKALARAGKVLGLEKRRIDRLARFGGEEFALVAPDTDGAEAFMLAERLRIALRDEFCDDQIPLTISFGVATLPQHGATRQELVSAADDALYAAKELGRDRTVIYSKEVIGVLTPANGRNSRRNEHLATMLSLTQALDMGEAGTADHSQAVGRYCEMTAREMGLDETTVERVRLAGLLHDIGNVAISNLVLSKPGPLTVEEWTEIRRHSEIGARILANARLGDIGQWVLAHHERVDGEGFPFGLSNGSIPLEARILAVADAFEAMTSERPYRAAFSTDEAIAELRDNAGTQFDADVVDAMLRALEVTPSCSAARESA
jgi:diguanylate cyclase (GGDEF)-like protein/putative nucleotidyltransferase with HDIG domain